MSRRHRILSHHLLYRKAEERATLLRRLQRAALDGSAGARKRLDRYGAFDDDVIEFIAYRRGPWRYKVVALPPIGL